MSFFIFLWAFSRLKKTFALMMFKAFNFWGNHRVSDSSNVDLIWFYYKKGQIAIQHLKIYLFLKSANTFFFFKIVFLSIVCWFYFYFILFFLSNKSKIVSFYVFYFYFNQRFRAVTPYLIQMVWVVYRYALCKFKANWIL